MTAAIDPAKPRVTIGMPVYNGEAFVRQALDSLLSQTLRDFELLISDNASTDATAAICCEYAARDPRIRYIRQNENIGPLPNFQFVLDQAAGEFFMWAAADDLWDPGWLETLYALAVRRRCVAYGILQVIDESGALRPHPANLRTYEFSGIRLLRKWRYFVQPAFLGKGNPVYGLFPTDYLKKVGISTVGSEKLGADMLFLYVLLDGVEIRHAGRVCLYKRIHANSAGGAPLRPRARPARAVAAVLRGAVAGALVGRYMRRSTALERVLLGVAYPVYIALGLAHTVLYTVRRIASR